jgi:hypothetical protein
MTYTAKAAVSSQVRIKPSSQGEHNVGVLNIKTRGTLKKQLGFKRLKSGMYSIIFRRMAAILNQTNRVHVHHLTPLRPTVLLFFDLCLIFHRFPPTFPLPHTFYLPRPFNHPLFDDYKIIIDWRIEGSNPSGGEIFRFCPDWP